MSRTLPNVIRNVWLPGPDGRMMVARILDRGTAPEGLDVQRIRFTAPGTFSLEDGAGHFLSVLSGAVTMRSRLEDRPLRLTVTAHAYIPPGALARLEAPAGAEVLLASGATDSRAAGDRLLVRDEEFVAVCATPSQPLRWVLTSQYLSRRIFLHHDATLLSGSGAPVSWYRTTMFDVTGLPPNEQGDPVFKMAYSSRTEFNVCYRVEGRSRVRMAEHPYRDEGQVWGPWLTLDDDATYHVNEAAGGEEEELVADPVTGRERTLRNKHEVSIADGHVTLICLFDPAPTGIERHRPGTYSDYEPLAEVLGTDRYERYLADVRTFDETIDELSMAQARGELEARKGSSLWQRYEDGRRNQVEHDAALMRSLSEEGSGREHIVAPWTRDPTA